MNELRRLQGAYNVYNDIICKSGLAENNKKEKCIEEIKKICDAMFCEECSYKIECVKDERSCKEIKFDIISNKIKEVFNEQ